VALKSLSPTVKILGDSTMHKWEANATVLTVTAVVKPGDLLANVKAGALSGLELAIGVDGLQSTESKSMDKNMHNAMESDKAPQITFSLTSYTVDGDNVAAKGSLSIHNVAKDVELKGVLTAKDGVVTVKGSYDLLMSDYGVKPPVMMLGTVKVKDLVTIAYQFDLAK
jgi:polyisoprenoid-binding protein YceI